MLVFGTTPHVTAVTEFAGRPVGDGKPGPVWRELSRFLKRIKQSCDAHGNLDVKPAMKSSEELQHRERKLCCQAGVS